MKLNRILATVFGGLILITSIQSPSSAYYHDDTSGNGKGKSQAVLNSGLGTESYLVTPEDMIAMGYPDIDVKNQIETLKNLPSVEYSNWKNKVSAQTDLLLDSNGKFSINVNSAAPQALNPCYGLQNSGGGVYRYCNFGTTRVNINNVRYISPGNSLGRVYYRPAGGGARDYYYTVWRSGTDAWFQMPQGNYGLWPTVIDVQRSPLGAVPQGDSPS